MDKKAQEIVADLKSYLEYLKGMGIEALPVSEIRSDEDIRSEVTSLEEIRKELGDCKRCKRQVCRRSAPSSCVSLG